MLAGGDGDDSYRIDDAGDLVVEGSGVASGTDTVYTTVSHALVANVEHGVLQGSSDIDLYGNALVNMLTGNAGNNLLDGGAGADTLAGGDGDDTYVVDTPGRCGHRGRGCRHRHRADHADLQPGRQPGERPAHRRGQPPA